MYGRADGPTNGSSRGAPPLPVSDDERFSCPFCHSHEVDRLFLAAVRLDSCACLSCGARWDEDAETHEFRGRSSRSSILAPRE